MKRKISDPARGYTTQAQSSKTLSNDVAIAMLRYNISIKYLLYKGCIAYSGKTLIRLCHCTSANLWHERFVIYFDVEILTLIKNEITLN